jgi:hypothetical protein
MTDKPSTRAEASKVAGWVPFLCVLAAIIALAGSALTWVLSPNWRGHHTTTSAARNVGKVPTVAGALAAFVSPNGIEIPRLAAKAPIVNVTTLPSGSLDVPLDPKTVGWWNGGAKPGAKKGTAMLAEPRRHGLHHRAAQRQEDAGEVRDHRRAHVPQDGLAL